MSGPIETVLVPLDGSEMAERALPLAAEIADRSGAPLVLLSAPQLGDAELADVSDFEIRLPGVMSMEAMQALRSSMREETLSYLEARAVPFSRRGLGVETIVTDDPPSVAIVKAADGHAGTLVVMGTHGRSGLGRWAFGSVAERVLHAGPRSLLLVPAGADHVPKAPKSVLLPLDGTPSSESVLPVVLRLAGLFDAKIKIAHVLPRFDELVRAGHGPLIDLERRYEDWLREYLAGIEERLSRDGFDVVTLELAGPDVADALLAQSARDDIDLIALSSTPDSESAELTMSSVVSRIVRSTRTPVLVHRGTAT